MSFSSFYKKNILLGIFLVGIFVIPAISLAAPSAVSDFQSLLGDFMRILNDTAIPVLIAIEIIVFIIGVIRYFMNPDTERTEASRFLMFAISAIFATVALMGIVALIQRSVGIGSGGTIQPPKLPEKITISYQAPEPSFVYYPATESYSQSLLS